MLAESTAVDKYCTLFAVLILTVREVHLFQKQKQKTWQFSSERQFSIRIIGCYMVTVITCELGVKTFVGVLSHRHRSNIRIRSRAYIPEQRRQTYPEAVRLVWYEYCNCIPSVPQYKHKFESKLRFFGREFKSRRRHVFFQRYMSYFYQVFFCFVGFLAVLSPRCTVVGGGCYVTPDLRYD